MDVKSIPVPISYKDRVLNSKYASLSDEEVMEKLKEEALEKLNDYLKSRKAY